MDTIIIGKILKPQGIKGQLKVLPITSDINRFEKLNSIYIENATYNLTSCQIRDEYVYITLEGFKDRNSIEAFREKFISVEKENAIKLPKDTWFIYDLEGCSVFDTNNNNIGILTEVLQNGAADVYVLNKGKIMFPALKKLLVNVDIENKKITVDEKVLCEVAVYED